MPFHPPAWSRSNLSKILHDSIIFRYIVLMQGAGGYDHLHCGHLQAGGCGHHHRGVSPCYRGEVSDLCHILDICFCILNMWHLKPPLIRLESSHNSYYPLIRLEASHSSYYPLIRLEASHNCQTHRVST